MLLINLYLFSLLLFLKKPRISLINLLLFILIINIRFAQVPI
jgi:hypothetical protein